MKTVTFVVLSLLSVNAAAAQTYPDRPIRLIVGFAAGGPTDVAARVVGDKLAEAWGKPVIVENVTGAAGNVAADRVAKAAPDGYTLFAAASATIVTNPNLYQKLTFDPVKDFAPITQIGFTPNLLVVPTDLPVKSVAELVAHARAESRQAHLRLGRRRHLAASGRRTLQDDGRHRYAARSLSRYRGRDPRSARRADQLRVRQHHHDDAAGARGEAASARGHVAAPLGVGARHADHDRTGLPGFRVRPHGSP